MGRFRRSWACHWLALLALVAGLCLTAGHLHLPGGDHGGDLDRFAAAPSLTGHLEESGGADPYGHADHDGHRPADCPICDVLAVLHGSALPAGLAILPVPETPLAHPARVPRHDGPTPRLWHLPLVRGPPAIA